MNLYVVKYLGQFRLNKSGTYTPHVKMIVKAVDQYIAMQAAKTFLEDVGVIDESGGFIVEEIDEHGVLCMETETV